MHIAYPFGLLKKLLFTEMKRNPFWVGKRGASFGKLLELGGGVLIKIDFDNISDELVYEAFGVDGNEAEALNDAYLELFELLGKDILIKIFRHYHGDKIDCPMRMYRPEFVADLAKQEPDRRERAKIARAAGYSAKLIEGLLSKRRKENGNDSG